MRPHSKTGQRVALVALLFVGVVTLGLGFYKVRLQITRPFEAQISRAESDQLAQFFDQQQQEEDTEALKKQDTDGDGLSDYDEINVHKTSPYLKDTDSDSYDDAIEIKSGNDPNCAAGKTCFAPVTSSVASLPTGQAVSANPVSALEQDLKKLESLTPAQVRELLKKQGFTDDDFADVDDAELISIYRESLKKAIEIEKQKQATAKTGSGSISPRESVPDPISAGAGAASQQQILQQLNNLNKPQIIQLLQETGELSQEHLTQLQQLDETQLKAIFYQALQNAQTTIDSKQQQ
ncbi:hypothetical protein HY623_00635 [Candidatus Uhrbacteria bacterium]|nr:hypothetical protein [Candidatus Uhrbacteria bacterium]